MSEVNAKSSISSRKKRRGQSPFQDALPKKTESRQSFESALIVHKAFISQRNKSFPGAESSRLAHRLLVASSSNESNDSFSTAHSHENCDNKTLPLTTVESIVPSDHSVICNEPSKTRCDVSDEHFLTACETDSFCQPNSASVFDFTDIIPDPDVTNETLTSNDEEIIEVPSFEISAVRDNTLSKSVNDLVPDVSTTKDLIFGVAESQSPENVQGKTQNTSYEVSEPTSASDIITMDAVEVAAMVVSAVTSQSYMEALTEDSDYQIDALRSIRNDEMEMNKSLCNYVSELNIVQANVGALVADVADSYTECYKELREKHEVEVQAIKSDAEMQIKELNTKLQLADLKLAGKDEIESALQDRVNELEKIIQDKEKDCKDELEGLVAECIRHDVIAVAKSEIEDEIGDHEEEQNAKNSKLSEENQKLRDECLLLKESISAADARCEKLTQEIDDLTIWINKVREHNEKLLLDNKKLEGEMRTLTDDNLKQVSELTVERDTYMREKLDCEAKFEDMERALAEQKQNNINLEKKVSELTKENCVMLSEKDEVSKQQTSFDVTVADLRRQLDDLAAQNEVLEKTLNSDLKRLSMHDDLGQFNMSESFNRSFNLSSVLRELKEGKTDSEILQCCRSPRESLSESCFKGRDSTQYFGVASSISFCDVTCQTDEAQFTDTKKCQCERSELLQKDLEISWTERCEVDEKLAELMSENAILRQHTLQLEAATRRATGLIGAGVPSAAAWLQLRAYVRDIVAELAVMQNTLGLPHNKSNAIYDNDVSSFNATEYPNLTAPLAAEEERSSPEGCRASPPIVDTIDSSDEGHEICSSGVANDDACNIISNQSLSALEMLLTEFRQCGSGDDTLDGDTTGNTTLGCLMGAGNIRMSLQQIMDEVLHLVALSKRDPDVAILQQQVASLESQVESSDKQVRLTRAFLEEQAVEREQERDEAAQRIEELSEQLRIRDRQLINKELLEHDMVILERQLADMQTDYHEEREQRIAMEDKLQLALSKVEDMREILEDLEVQLLEKNKQLEIAASDYALLQERIHEVGQISLERENAQQNSLSDTLLYVTKLEEEVTNLRRQVEISGPESVSSARGVIRELEMLVAHRTRDMELVQVFCRHAVSSASEELSTRDHIDATRCVTPDEMAGEAGLGLYDDVERLKERLTKLARMEEAAIKRIKELEATAMLVDEQQVEMEVAMRRVDQLLKENETLKARLEAERPRASDAQRILSLEDKIRQLESDLETVTEALQAEKKTVTEKCRREERLLEAVQTLEAELRTEADTVNPIKEQLQGEKNKRIALENKLEELLKKLNENSNISREGGLSQSDESRNMSGSSSFSKRVRFHEPHSFVGDSVTPIPYSSVLRDDPSARGDGIVSEFLSQKMLPWDSISSVAAAQLSARGAISQISNLPHSPTHDISPQNISDLAQINKTLLEEKSLLQQRLNEAKELLIATDEKWRKSHPEIIELRLQLTHEREAKENLKKSFQEEQVKNHAQVVELTSELVKLQKNIASLKGKVVELEDDLENEGARSLALATDLRMQRDMVMAQLEKKQIELENLNGQLKLTNNELMLAKFETLDFEKEVKNLSNKSDELSKQMKEEIDMLRKEQSFLLSREAELRNQLDVVEARLAGKVEEIEASQRILQERESEINNLKKELGGKENLLEANKKECEELTVKIKQVLTHQANLEENLLKSRGDADSLREQIKEIAAERNQLNAALVAAETKDSTSTSEFKKLVSEKVVSLRTCLEATLLKNGSLEAELAIARACLETAETKAAALEGKEMNENHAIKQMKIEMEMLRRQKQELDSQIEFDNTQRQEEDPTELLVLSVKLEKARTELASVKAKETELKRMLASALNLGREASNRESELRIKLSAAENEMLGLQHALASQAVSLRALEHIQWQGTSPSRRMVESSSMRGTRSAGAADNSALDWQYQVQRLESYRKALVFQKQLLVAKPGSRLIRSNRSKRRPSFRVVALLFVSISRMRYLVRRWRSRLPPITSPPRRSERPLMLVGSSPPCKDPGLKLN